MIKSMVMYNVSTKAEIRDWLDKTALKHNVKRTAVIRSILKMVYKDKELAKAAFSEL